MKQNYSTFAKRLRYIIGNDSLLCFSKKCNLSESAIRKYIREESEPTLQNLLTMAKVGNVSVAWLATGDDPFLSDPNLLPKDSKNIVTAIPEVELNNILEIDNGKNQSKKSDKIITEWIVSREWLSRTGLTDESLAIVQVPYNNMKDTIKLGDMIIVKIKKDILNQVLSGIYIIKLNEKFLIKRIQYDPIENGYLLINDNPTYQNHLITHENLDQLVIVAKVVHILANVI